MELILNTQNVGHYTSASQRVRVSSESWVETQIFCPNCGNGNLARYPNNNPVADFFCRKCREDFELKSKKNSVGKKIVDGAYKMMLDRLAQAHTPNLFLLHYDVSSWQVLNFFVIPQHFFVSDIIEKRNPLSASARRKGWVGCNILLNRIPESGRIFFVRNKFVQTKEKVCTLWQKTLFLREEDNVESKGWLLDVMRCIELVKKDVFMLTDVYNFESVLSKQHPQNKHIKDKIRQQLQVLRDRNFIRFLSRGEYQIV